MRDGTTLAIVYVLILRVVFPHQLAELLEVVPGGQMLARIALLSDPRAKGQAGPAARPENVGCVSGEPSQGKRAT